MEKHPIVCMCGSTKFKEDFLEWNKILTLKGWIVLMPGVFGHAGDEISIQQQIQLDQLHRHKIALADIVFVVDKDNYIGVSTRAEIDLATSLNIPILYMSDLEKVCEEDESS